MIVVVVVVVVIAACLYTILFLLLLSVYIQQTKTHGISFYSYVCVICVFVCVCMDAITAHRLLYDIDQDKLKRSEWDIEKVNEK